MLHIWVGNNHSVDAGKFLRCLFNLFTVCTPCCCAVKKVSSRCLAVLHTIKPANWSETLPHSLISIIFLLVLFSFFFCSARSMTLSFASDSARCFIMLVILSVFILKDVPSSRWLCATHLKLVSHQFSWYTSHSRLTFAGTSPRLAGELGTPHWRRDHLRDNRFFS